MRVELERRWEVAPRLAREAAEAYAGLPPLIAQLLHNRGVGPEEAAAFLDGVGEVGHDPFAMKGMDAAVERLQRAWRAGERVVVYGDYDGDGVTASAVLTQALGRLGVRADVYIPHRVDEGYGLNAQALEAVAAQGAGLVVTVDCGTGSVAEVERARALGLDVIVTDHHLPPETLAPATALLNPRQPGCAYPTKSLAGVGVAYKLLQGLLRAWPGAPPLEAEEYLDLVALGTISDVVPLRGENRLLVRGGLERMRLRPRPGVAALARRAGVRLEAIQARDVSFVLGPRINAAGRMDDAILAYNLLMARDEAHAAPLAEELEQHNLQRQRELARVLHEARAALDGQGDEAPAIVVWGEGWPLGIVGLVASRLMEEHRRPAFVCSLTDEAARGSARTPEGYHAVEALEGCADLLARYGGHARAAGFTAPIENLPRLRRRLVRWAEGRGAAEPALGIDAWLRLASVDWGLHAWLQRLGPFGQGNPEPLFAARRVRARGVRTSGEQREHLRFTLSDGRRTLDAVAYRMASCEAVVRDERPIDIAFSLADTPSNGFRSLLLVIRDIRPAS